MTRRQVLFVAGGFATTGLLAASGVAHASVLRPRGPSELENAVAAVFGPPQRVKAAPLAHFQQASQSGVALAAGVLNSVCTAPIWTADSPTGVAWAGWAVSLGEGLLNILSAVPSLNAATNSKLSSSLESAMGYAEGVLAIFQSSSLTPGDRYADAAFGLGIVSSLAAVINPAKLGSEVGAIVVAATDVICGAAGCAAGFLNAFDPANA